MSETATLKPRFPIRVKLSLMAGILTVVPLVAVGVALININVRAVQTTIREFQIAVADDVARSVDSELASAQDTLNGVASVLIRPGLEEDNRITLALTLVESSEAIDHAALFGPEGKFIDALREEKSPKTPTDPLPKAIRERAEARNVAVGAAQIIEGSVRVPVTIPLRAQGKVTGYASSYLDLSPVQARVKRLGDAHFTGLTDPILVVDDRSRVVARAGASARLEPAPALPLLSHLGQAALDTGVSRSEEYSLGGGTAMVGALVGTPRAPWGVVIQQPRDVVYGSIDQMRLVIALTVVATIALALFVALVMARRISAPLAELAAFAGSLARRDFNTRMTVNTNDELSLLGNAMFKAAKDLASSEQRIKDEVAIRTDLGRYLPQDLVDQVVAREQDMGLGGRRTPITVLFCDVVGFTPLTERLPPEEVVALLNELFTILTEIVFRHGGTVDKFIGDALMAIWGAPKPTENHAGKAIAAAEEMIEWLDIGNARWRDRFGVQLELAVGVNSGEAVVGNVGSESRMEYTAIGDAVNVAARLESVAQPMQVIVSEATMTLTRDQFDYEPLGEQKVTGRKRPVQIYALER